jgi:hypothetical protein
MHPLDITHITLLMDNGFQPADLYRVVNNRTVLEHLHEGQSIEWCLGALRFSLRS